MGNTCKSMADSCQCMTNPLQYCKVISLQLIKINEKKLKKKKKKESWSGLSCTSPGDLPDPGIEPGSPTWQADSLPSEPPDGD